MQISSHTGFQPLKEVWLGGIYPESFYTHLSSETQDIFGRITELTNNDLSRIEQKISELGVVVRRPAFDRVDDYLDERSNLIKPPICPRDWAITIADTLYITPQYMSGVEPFQPTLDLYKSHGQNVKILSRQQETCDPMAWVGFPSVVRVGRDLYTDYSFNAGSSNEVEKFNEIVISEWANNYRVHVTNTGDHSDGIFCPISPGRIFSTHYRSAYDDTFPGWEVFFLTDTTKDRSPSNGYNGRWWLPGLDYPSVNQQLVRFADTWLGESRETIFEVNMLVIDDKNVICIAEDDRACRKLEEYGVTPHVVDFKTRGFWDGGLHCLTLDIHRDGPCVDYWPDRGPNGVYRYK